MPFDHRRTFEDFGRKAASDRERQADRRRRRRENLDRLAVEVDLGATADALVSLGLLPEWDCENRRAVAEALSRHLQAEAKRIADEIDRGDLSRRDAVSETDVGEKTSD